MIHENILIMFDIFGVIFTKGLESSINLLEAVFNRRSKRITPVYRKWEKEFDLGQIDEIEFWNNINKDLNTNIDSKILTNIILSGYKLNDNVIRLAKRLSQLSTIAVYSNYRREWFDRLNHKFNITNQFEYIYISSDTGILKPDPRVFSFINKKHGVSIENTLLIDDDPINVISAENIGAKGIRFSNIYQTEVLIPKLLNIENWPYDEFYSGILLETSEGALILQRRDNNPNIANPGMLSVFGGRRLSHESDLDCAMRELNEETRFKPSAVKFEFIDFLSCPIEENKWMKCSFYALKNIDINKIDVKEGQHIEVWWPEKVLSEKELTPVTKTIIKHYYHE